MLNQVEVRVIGSLVEKQLTTPEYYPLTLNALVNACNQTTNRDPVVSFNEKAVARALESLREKKLVWMVTVAGNRVPKYEHRLAEAFNLTPQELAVTCVLMLRGPQTPGEIRSRTGRMHQFRELIDVEQTLDALIEKKPDALAIKLPRLAGMKESRYAHLLSGEVRVEQHETPVKLETATIEVRAENERIARLEQEVERLRGNLDDLLEQFAEFKKQFE
jgi:uncharacterized protein YceH (UPF0502 family)